jgi:hypothetical protein
MRRLRAVFAALALVALCVAPPLAARADSVCQGAPASVSVNISSAATTQVVALSGSTVVYVCSFFLSVNGTNPTVQFEYGTGSSCATSPVVLTGAIAPLTGSVITAGALVQFQTAPGNALCIVSAGTTPSIQGYVTYVQR